MGRYPLLLARSACCSKHVAGFGGVVGCLLWSSHGFAVAAFVDQSPAAAGQRADRFLARHHYFADRVKVGLLGHHHASAGQHFSQLWYRVCAQRRGVPHQRGDTATGTLT